MEAGDSSDITELLKSWALGDAAALNRLTELVYEDLRRIAHRYMQDERAGNSIQTTGLINEAYMRLVDVRNVDWQHRAQFFALSAALMRRILVDAVRTRLADKRGGRVVRINMDDAPLLSPEPDRFILALNDALSELTKLAPRQGKVVELRYFGGLTEEEAAEVLKTSPRTVRRDWQFARAWLTRQLK
jgi:RNA polymerase sigma factor (TIGR02999 family)